MMAKMENIQTTLIEFKTELKGYREEVDRVNEQSIRNEESLKSLRQKRIHGAKTVNQFHLRHHHPSPSSSSGN